MERNATPNRGSKRSIAGPKHGEPGAALRVVVLGRPCRLTAMPLAALLASRHEVVATLIPARGPGSAAPRRIARRASLPMAATAGREPATVEHLTASADVPLYGVADLAAGETIQMLRGLRPDVLVLACFPWRLPRAAREIPRVAALNLHPSLLPRHRGPDPLFWAYRHDDRTTGVTVHLVTGRLDAGPLLAQEVIPIERGMPGDALEQTCAERGAALLLAALDRISRGEPRPRAQDEGQATYEGWPASSDLRIPGSWPAERAWHFAAGVTRLGYTPTVEIDGRHYEVVEAVGFSSSSSEPAPADDDTLPRLTRADGVALLRVRASRSGAMDASYP